MSGNGVQECPICEGDGVVLTEVICVPYSVVGLTVINPSAVHGKARLMQWLVLEGSQDYKS